MNLKLPFLWPIPKNYHLILQPLVSLGYLATNDTPPSSLMDSIVSLKMKAMKGEGVRACFLACSTLGVKGRVGAPKWD
jgi:hypothetical protein